MAACRDTPLRAGGTQLRRSEPEMLASTNGEEIGRSLSARQPRRSSVLPWSSAAEPSTDQSPASDDDSDGNVSCDSMDDVVTPLRKLAAHWFQPPNSPMMPPARSKLPMTNPLAELDDDRLRKRRPPPSRKPKIVIEVESPPPQQCDALGNAVDGHGIKDWASVQLPLFVQLQRGRLGLYPDAS